ncbi:MAG TPA: Ig-like domain-containing protein [Puia sp.]|nr:Ig-like domain-containing protein [Puia sp.]
MKRVLTLLLLVFIAGIFRSTAQIVSFSFSGTPTTVSGWTNLPGDPHSGAQTATAAGITVSSISAANWVPNTVPSNVYDYGGNADATYFPAAVMANTWLQWNGNSDNLALYNASVPQLQLSGLNPDSTYILRMSGSDNYYTGSTQYTVAGASVSGSQYLNTYKDSTQGVTFTGVRPDANGHINVYVNATSTSSFAFISGLQVFSGTAANVGTPVVALTAPVNGTVQSEGGNFILTATAAETGGSIAKVEFYADTTKIGEADASPYTMTWVDPDPGAYQLTAKATDAIGTIATASVNVGVQSLNYFWSTTGNAATNGDSNFVGTVDSNRLAFRTKNVERMSIGVNGTTTIGSTIHPDTVNIHGLINITDSVTTDSDTVDPLTMNINAVYSPWMKFINTNPSIGSSMGMRYYNDSGLVAQFFSGSYHDYYEPNGFAFHLISNGGFEFVGQQNSNYFSWGNNFKVFGGSQMIFYPHTGHLIIGSTIDSGNNKLQVNGTTWTTAFTMPTGAGPGYVLTSDSAGHASWQSEGGASSVGPGLEQTPTGVALGDSIPGPGPHSFTSNRYQYLNGNQYSIGGSVNDPVNRPVFRMYDNGDFVASTTMDRSIAAPVPRGLRYYSKLGVLQIGSLDRLDTTVNVSSMTGGIVLDAEDSASTSVLKAEMYDAYVAGNEHNLDSTASLVTSIVNGGGLNLSHGDYGNDIISGWGINLSGSIDNSIIVGNGNSLTKTASVDNISGYLNNAIDTSRGSLVAGAGNQFGGLWQTVSGVYLIDRTPAGVTLGSGNVDFATMPSTGTVGLSTPGLAGYPLFAVGNSSSYSGFRSNALTVLYNGRTQINTTGFSSALTQAQVTPAAALDVVSTNTGVLLPRLTTAQRNAIVTGDLHNGLLLYNTDSSAFQYYNGTAWNSVGGGVSSGGRWQFANGTVYDSTDNIAIGTSNPQGYKLAVNGTGIFTKIVAKPQASWPDYVFDKGYKLPSLQDLAQYLREHHHLPDVAAESEIMRSGIDLGQQQTTLLKKVEELTLYLIRENQSLSDQTKQLADQNKQMTQQTQTLTEQAKQLAEQNRQLNDQNARLEAQQKEIDELKAMIQANHKQ